MTVDDTVRAVLSNIRQIRVSNVKSQEDVAAALNIDRQSYARMERGEVELSFRRLVEISDIYKMTPVEVIEFPYSKDKYGDAFESKTQYKSVRLLLTECENERDGLKLNVDHWKGEYYKQVSENNALLRKLAKLK